MHRLEWPNIWFVVNNNIHKHEHQPVSKTLNSIIQHPLQANIFVRTNLFFKLLLKVLYSIFVCCSEYWFVCLNMIPNQDKNLISYIISIFCVKNTWYITLLSWYHYVISVQKCTAQSFILKSNSIYFWSQCQYKIALRY